MTSIFREFSKRYFKEAIKDFERARRALDFNDWPQAIFYSQQCVEKCVKAILEAFGEYWRNHGIILASRLRQYIDRLGTDVEYVAEVLENLQEYYTRSRYPTLFRGHVYSPEEIIDEELAREAVYKAEKVIKIIERWLHELKVLE